MDKLISLLLAAGLIAGAVYIFAGRLEAPPQRQETISVVSAAPPTAQTLPHNAATVSREEDGQYWTRADVDGTSVRFLVDTGASVVALNWRDAQRLRLKPEELDFKWSIRTANGETFGASVLLPSIRIGNVEIENVEAMVMQEGLLDSSLLGMSFLGALYSYEFRGDTLIIRQ
ncbi:MAG: TIGR02281 family clan AA aspartic protease [Pseudomonadota bacterium]